VGLEKRLLGLTRERHHKRATRVTGAHMEDEHLRGDSPQDHHRLTPVDLRLNTGIVHQGNHPRRGLAQLPAPVGHPLAHRTLRNLRAVLFAEALPDAMGGVALLARGGPVGDQPLVDQLSV
jgi:hypothetical protein